MQVRLDNFGTLGAVLAAAACPVCFPKLALVGALIGLGAFASYEAYFFYATQAMVLTALAGHLIYYRKTKNVALLAFALCSSALFFVSLYVIVSETLTYLALAGLVIAIFWMTVENRRRGECTASVT